MREFVDRLQENKQIELAKSILESAGYIVEAKKSIKKSELSSQYPYRFTYTAGNSTWGDDLLRIANKNNAIKIVANQKRPDGGIYSNSDIFFVCKSPDDLENIRNAASKLIVELSDKVYPMNWDEFQIKYIDDYDEGSIKVEDDMK